MTINTTEKNTGNFAVYRSSAGSGKTFTLAREYLRLSLSTKSKAQYRHILAITFTRKASAEMKERVLHYLSEIGSGKDDIMAGLLTDDIGISREELMTRAKNVHHHILHNYSDLSIYTIDTFIHRILRSFARDLGLNMEFEVEMNEKHLLEQGVDELIRKIGAGEEFITKALVDFASEKLEDAKNWQVKKDLLDFSELLLKEESAPFLDVLAPLGIPQIIEARKKISILIKQTENKLQTLCKNAMDLLNSSNIDESLVINGRSGPFNYFERISSGNFDCIYLKANQKKGLEKTDWSSGAAKKNPSAKAALQEITPQLISILNQVQDVLEQEYSLYKLCKTIQSKIYPLMILSSINKELTNLKEEKNILPISDFNKKIVEIVRSESAPFIYERIGERYKHIMIDEFQDTSVMQWENFLPLFEESLSRGFYNLLVGDAKQAIYRFRNGEVKQFAFLPELPLLSDNHRKMELENLLKREIKPMQLDSNYRSRKAIVEFNNWFFDKLPAFLGNNFTTYYKDHSQNLVKKDKEGFVGIYNASKDVMKELLWSHIEKCREDGYEDQEMCLLVRKGKEGQEWAEFLRSKGIGVISQDSLLLNKNYSVNLIIAWLKWFNDPGDEFSKYQIAKHLIAEGNDDKNILHALDQYIFREKVSDKYVKRISLENLLRDKIPSLHLLQLKSTPLYSLCEEVANKLKLTGTDDEYILPFLSNVHSYSKKEGNSIAGFLNWWDINNEKLSIQLSDQLPAIRIMTVHKAKGLQFPIVFYPDAGKMGKKNFGTWYSDSAIVETGLPVAWIECPSPNEHEPSNPLQALREELDDKQILDELNVLYVATTRPELRLYMYLDAEAKGQTEIVKAINKVIRETHPEFEKEGKLELGKEEKNTGKKKEVLVKPIYSYGLTWQNRIKFSTENSRLFTGDFSQEALNKGKQIHAVLARIRYKEDLNKVLKDLESEGILSSEEITDINEYLKRIFSHEKAGEYFEAHWKVFNETGIILPKNQGTKRPDRVCIKDNHAVVIDYKTGAGAEKHLEQIRKYGEILKEMGYTKIDLFLMYILEDDILWQPVDMPASSTLTLFE